MQVVFVESISRVALSAIDGSVLVVGKAQFGLNFEAFGLASRRSPTLVGTNAYRS